MAQEDNKYEGVLEESIKKVANHFSKQSLTLEAINSAGALSDELIKYYKKKEFNTLDFTDEKDLVLLRKLADMYNELDQLMIAFKVGPPFFEGLRMGRLHDLMSVIEEEELNNENTN